MGCGKGYVMTLAVQYPFKKIAGVEYTKELCDICQRNLDILKIDSVKVFNSDAKLWDGYEDYDVYYFCNPFDETILSVVAKNIIDAHRDRRCWIYYMNPHQQERQKAIMDVGFKLVKILVDECEPYFTVNVYENI